MRDHRRLHVFTPGALFIFQKKILILIITNFTYKFYVCRQISLQITPYSKLLVDIVCLFSFFFKLAYDDFLACIILIISLFSTF
jgi:hypothetical protein